MFGSKNRLSVDEISEMKENLDEIRFSHGIVKMEFDKVHMR